MGHRRLQLAGVWAQPAGADVVHPGAAALAAAGRRVQVKLPHQLLLSISTCALNAVKLHIGVPNRCLVAGDGDVEQGFRNLEQARQHLGQGEVLLDLLFTEGVACLFEFFTNIGPIPSLWVVQAELFFCKFTQVGQVFFGKWACFGGQIAQKTNDCIRRGRHFGDQGKCSKIGVAKQASLLAAKRQNIADALGVVKLLQCRVCSRLV